MDFNQEDSFLSFDKLDLKQEEVAKATETQEEFLTVPNEQVQNSEELINTEATEEFANKQFEKTEAEKDTENKEDKPLSSESKDSSSTISVLANYLKEEGVFSSELEGLDKIESVSDLKELIAKQVQAERYADLSENQQRYLQSIESGVPLNEYEAAEKEIQALEQITLEELAADGQLRFDIIANDLINSGLSEEKATALAQRSFDLGKDQEDAKDSIQSLYNKSVEVFNAKMESKKVEKQATLEEVRKSIDSKEFVMSDIKLSKENKDEIFKMMTTQVDTTPEGYPVNAFGKWKQENGVEAEIILNALFINTNGFKNLGDIKTQVSSKAAKELELRLRTVESEELSRDLQGGRKLSSGMTLQ